MKRRIKLVDVTLRDGSHAVGHSFTKEQVMRIAGELDRSGVEIIEVTHGDGLGGSSVNYGFSAVSDMDLIEAAAGVIREAKLGALLLPGIGTIRDLEEAYERGVRVLRVATHVTEADVGIQHIQAAKRKGMCAVGFLMMIHMARPEKILEQARIFADAGADYINLADSAGHLVPDEVRERVLILTEHLNIPVGFHAHNNLGLAVANSIAAIEEGAVYIDGSLGGLGAGAGNTQIEVLQAVIQRYGWESGADLGCLLEAEKEVVPVMQRPQVIDPDSLMLGYSGVYSSFLLHAKRASQKFDVDTKDILVELGKRGMVGGQEDMIVDVAYELSKRKGARRSI